MESASDEPKKRMRTFEIKYHYYWPDENCELPKENEVVVAIRSEYYEETSDTPVACMTVNDAKITHKVVELIETELAQFDTEIVKTVRSRG